MKAFHAYDIRGIFNKDFTRDDVYRIGYFLPGLLNAETILVGRDARLSTPEIFESLSHGITDAGANVADAGLTTTPMIYWATAKYGFKGSVMITASHNPKEYNGLKISREKALPVGYDTGLKILEKHINDNDAVTVSESPGSMDDFEIIPEYLSFQQTYTQFQNKLKIAFDCSNGMAGLLARDLYGNETIYLNEDPDGSFPSHDANPLNPESIKQLQETVVSEKCDIGIIFDGDADRVMFIDENGRFIPPDLIIALMAPYFLSNKRESLNVLQDIRTSRSVTEYVTRKGGIMHMWRVGRAFAALKLRQIEGLYGGELAGHYYFRDFYYSDSAFMATSIVLSILNKAHKSGKKLSSMIDEIATYANSGEINFKIEKKKAAMEAVKDYFLKNEVPVAFYDFDGYRIEFDSWWFNIRPSNTEPYLRLLVEANTPERLDDKIEHIKSILKKFS